MTHAILNRCLSIASHKLVRHDGVFKHIAFVIVDGRIAAWGFNRGSHTGYPRWTKVHAEVNALNRAWSGRRVDVVSVRLNRFGELRDAKPCGDCQRRLSAAKVSEVMYTTRSGFERLRT